MGIRYFFLCSMKEACVADRHLLTPDLEVWGSSLAHCVVSLDKELYSTLSLFTQVYIKMGTGDILLGGNPAMD